LLSSLVDLGKKDKTKNSKYSFDVSQSIFDDMFIFSKAYNYLVGENRMSEIKYNLLNIDDIIYIYLKHLSLEEFIYE